MLQRLYTGYPLHFGIRDPFKTKRKYTMTKSIGTNLKTITKQSVNLPLELTAASVELLAEVATLGSAFITTAKDVGKATGTFVLGVFNSELTDEQLKAKASTLTFASIRASIVAVAGKAGQGLVKAWDDETTSNSDKQD